MNVSGKKHSKVYYRLFASNVVSYVSMFTLPGCFRSDIFNLLSSDGWFLWPFRFNKWSDWKDSDRKQMEYGVW